MIDIVFSSKVKLQDIINHALSNLELDGRINYRLTIKRWKSNRTLAQNRLYWRWNREISNYINEATGDEFTDDDMHEFFKNLFLESKLIELYGKKIKRFKTTTDLTVNEFIEYLLKIEAWCYEHDIKLIRNNIYDRAIGGKS